MAEEAEKRRSKRNADKASEAPKLVKRSAAEANINNNPEDVKKRPKSNKMQPTGGSLADKQFTHLTSNQSSWQSLLQKQALTPLEMMQEAAFTEVLNK